MYNCIYINVCVYLGYEVRDEPFSIRSTSTLTDASGTRFLLKTN